MNPPGLLKLRLFAANHRKALIGGLVLVAVVATVGSGWAYAHPGTVSETEHRHAQTIAGSVDTSATVTGNSSLYETGETLSNQRVYLLRATPNLTLAGNVDSPNDTVIHQRLVLEYRATRDEQVVWEQSSVLAAADNATMQTTVNASRVKSTVEGMQGEFGAAASVSTRLRYVVEYDTGRYDGEFNATVPLLFTQRAYVLDGELAAQHTETTPVTVTRQRSPNYAHVGGLAGVALLSLGGAVALVRRDQRVVPEADTEQLHRQRYAEWISSGRIPIFSANQRIEMDSLADLVNVAIDSNERVIYDSQQNAYGVLKEGGHLFWYASDDRIGGLSMEWRTTDESGRAVSEPTPGTFEDAFEQPSEFATPEAEIDEGANPTTDPPAAEVASDQFDWEIFEDERTNR